jgi:hypothetical protein
VTAQGTGSAPRLAVSFEPDGAASGPEAVAEARRLVTSVLGVQVELGSFYSLAERDAELATLARRFVGVRPPGSRASPRPRSTRSPADSSPSTWE